MCFIVGLVTPAFAFGGLDSTIHLVEEAQNPRRSVSRAILSTVVLGITCAILFMLAMVYCIGDIQELVTTPTGYDICSIHHYS